MSESNLPHFYPAPYQAYGKPTENAGPDAVNPVFVTFQEEMKKMWKLMEAQSDWRLQNQPPETVDGVLEKGIPGFHYMRQRCPMVPGCGGPVRAYLRDTIIHLNDEHRWSREQIADWLETLDHDLRFQVDGRR